MSQDDWEKPYRKVKAAEELLEENSLTQDYVALYKKKYRGEPLFDVNKVHLAQIKHFRSVAKDKAHALLHHYFSMADPWFVQQAYSLDCLIKNLHKVNASFSKHSTVHKDSGKIQIRLECDSCWKSFTYVCDLHFDFLKKEVRCLECEAHDIPPRRVSKEERRRTILKLGAIFPEMPLDSKNQNE